MPCCQKGESMPHVSAGVGGGRGEMTIQVLSENGVPIHLTDERWAHITEEHCELAGRREEVLETITDPARVMESREGELLAVREVEPGKFLVVVYRELPNDGFIITSFLTRRANHSIARKQLWL